MRVVIVLDVAYLNGGQAKVAIDSAIGLKKLGLEPIFFAAAGPPAPALRQAGIQIETLGQSEFVADPSRLAAFGRGLHNGAASRALAALLETLPARDTIVHVHGFAKALSSAIATPIRRSGLPALYTMHEYYLLCPNGGFYNYRAHHHCPLTPLSGACLATHCDTRSFGFKAWRAARGMVARHWHKTGEAFRDIAYFHPFQRAIIAPHLPPSTRLHEIANPVDIAPMGQKPDPCAGEILFLGRLSAEKGVLLYAEAARRAGILPVFVGDGPEAANLRALYPEARLLGWHDEAGVRAQLRAARALVFPSLWYEGQPLSVLEALALGTPVIAGDGSAGRESVVDGKTGLWFKQADAADLARAMTMLRDDARITQFSRNAYARYWDDPLTIERHCARLMQIYEALLARDE